MSSDDKFKLQRTVDEIRTVLKSIIQQGTNENRPLFEALELIYVSLLGHHCSAVREAAVVDLNVLYDGHTLQASEALPVTIADTGVAPAFDIQLAHSIRTAFDASVFENRRVVLRMYGPHAEDSVVSTWKEFKLTASEYCNIKCDLPPFPRPGFYDWVIAESGSTIIASLDDSYTESHRKLRGRFIVQPAKARQSVIMEMPVDEVGAVWDEKTGQLRTRGTFDAVSRKLQMVKAQGVTAVYMMGALERPSGEKFLSSPLTVVDRQCPAEILGGEQEFQNVVKEISQLGMTPIIDALDRVSRNRMHRKYKSLTIETLDKRGIPLRHPGTDGQQNQWEDTALLNYRRVDTWKLFLDEVRMMANKYGVRGIRLDNAQSFPPIMAPNVEELLRVDTDGQPHYSLDEVFFGAVVKASNEHGYWTSDSCIDRNYPNPFIVQLCKEMWKSYPDFLIIAEAHFHREASLLSSGAITHSVRIPQIIASISGNSFRRDGSVGQVPDGKRSSARTLTRLYRNDKVWLPRNPIMINCTCTHSSPYPGVLYGRRAWLAVDMLSMLPDVPMVLYGEERGRAYRINMATVSSEENMNQYDVNYDAILPKSPTKKPTSPGDVGLPALSLSSVSGLANLSALRGSGRLPPTSPTASRLEGTMRKPRMKRNNRSFADLRRPSSSQNMVRSVSRDDMRSMAIRSVSVEDLHRLTAREEAKRQEIGPSSGFDLAQIKGHYSHRMALRQKLESLKRGGMCILSVDPHLKEQVFAFSRFTENEVSIIVANFKDSRDGEQFSHPCHVDLDLRPLWDHLPDCYIKGDGPGMFYSVFDVLADAEHSGEPFTLEEIVFQKYGVAVAPLSVSVLQLRKTEATPETKSAHFKSCLHRILSSESNNIKDPRENYLIAQIARGAASSVSGFAKALDNLRQGLMLDGCNDDTIMRAMQLCIQRASQLLFMVAYENVPAPRDFDPPAAEVIVAYLTHISTAARDSKLLELTRASITQTTKLGPLVFLTAELGRFSTAGGLGVMVDELTKGLANLGLEVYVISPYYTVNRKNQTGYLGPDIKWTRNVLVNLGTHTVEVGVFEGRENGVNLIFLERGDYFSKVYADTGGAVKHLQTVLLMSLGSLEVCCQKSLVPSLIVSNDWLPSMAAGYRDEFAGFFKNTSFFHLIHNLGEAAYEGRCYPDGNLGHIHRLPEHLLVNPWWENHVVNPSRCALMRSDSWGTVSPSYLKELLGSHPLQDLLHIAKSPFAYPNGIRQAEREKKLAECGCDSHAEAKAVLQKKYFGFENGDPSIPLFAFVGRITSQKGVHLICNAVDELVAHTGGKIQILIGGPANYQDEYSARCAGHIKALRGRYPWCFWGNPDEFFTDGPMTNLGADFGLMPSLFEPGGIVQQEFFVAGTPVVAYKTGGLKDTVHEWLSEEGEGNGFTFEEYVHHDFVWAVKRALRVFSQPEEYEELRASAYETTIDVKEVAWAWSTEFHRLRNAMYTKSDVVSALIIDTVNEQSDLYDQDSRPVKISWHGEGSRILMKGSFDNWNQEWNLLPLTADEATKDISSRRHEIVLRLQPGEYVFKFKVDGEWVISEDWGKKADEAGFINNYLVVE